MGVESLVRNGNKKVGYIIDDGVFRYVMPFSFRNGNLTKTDVIANSVMAIEDFLGKEGDFKHVNHVRNWSDGRLYVEFDEHDGTLSVHDMYDRENEMDFINRFLDSKINQFFNS